MTKEVPHKQHRDKNGCNYYCIANLLNINYQEFNGYINQFYLDSKRPEGNLLSEFQENVYLRKYNPSWYFTTWYRVPKERSNIDYPELFANPEEIPPPHKRYFNVFLFSTKMNRIDHRVLVLREVESINVFVIDSLKPSIELYKSSDVFNKLKVRGISALRSESFMDILKVKGEDLSHLIW